MDRKDFLQQQNTTYEDWFGQGDLIEDLKEAEKFKGEEAKQIYRSDFMILIVFSNEYVVTGYDGNEYTHTFNFHKPIDNEKVTLYI